MEFLIAKFSSDKDAWCMDIDGPWPQISTLDGPNKAVRYKDFLFVGPRADTFVPQATILFDGHATIDGEAISGGDQTSISSTILEKLLSFSRKEKTYSGVSGVFVLVYIDIEHGLIEVFCDPLSQYNLFSANNCGIRVFSNSIYLIETLFRKVSQPQSRSFEVSAYETSLGFGGGLRTGLSGVTLVPADHRVRISISKNHIDYICQNTLSLEHSIDDLSPDSVANSMASSMKAIHNSFSSHDIVYDLTGGFDSRLVFAASLKTGQRNQLIFRSDGGPTHDVRIPDHIAREYGLDYAGFPENFDGEAISAIDFAKRAVFRQQGQSTIHCYELGRHRVSGVCRVRGGVGEMLRAVYSGKYERSFSWKVRRAVKAIKSGDTADLRYIFGLVIGDKSPLNSNIALISFLLSQNLGVKREFFTRNFRRSLTASIYDELENLLSLDIQEQAVLSGLYLTDRSRRHYGYVSQALNMVRPTFDPLSNIDLWHFASSYTLSERANGDALFDLMESLEPSLLDILYASSPLDKSTRGFKVFSDDFKDVEKPPEILIKSVKMAQFITESGLKPGIPYSHEAHILPHLEIFFDLLFSLDRTHEVWSILNRKVFDELYQNPECHRFFSQNALMFKRLFYGLIWVHSLEDDVQISGCI